MSYDKESGMFFSTEPALSAPAETYGTMSQTPAHPTLAERVEAIQVANDKHNNTREAILSGRFLTTDPVKIEQQLIKRMMGKGAGRSQTKRRKLCRQNPHLLKGKYKSRCK